MPALWTLWVSVPCHGGDEGVRTVIMSNMENLEKHLGEKERQQETYEAAIRAMEYKDARKAASGYAVMAAAIGYGEGALGKGTFGKISHGAKLFCIGFAFLVPSLLVWHVLL